MSGGKLGAVNLVELSYDESLFAVALTKSTAKQSQSVGGGRLHLLACTESDRDVRHFFSV